MDWVTAIKEIQKAQEDDRLVIFVGAGVSKNSGVPSWYELIIQINISFIQITNFQHGL